MYYSTRIPVNIRPPAKHELGSSGSRAASTPQVEPRAEPEPFPSKGISAEEAPVPDLEQPEVTSADDVGMPQVEHQEWRDRALRLQADMENYRRRQRRLARDEIQTERGRLLGGFLPLLDDLERALEASSGGAEGLRHGVELTHRAATQMLQKEGVERIEAGGQVFDPAWHEAVATVPRNGTRAEINTVVQVLEPGYRIGNRLLRPAKVVVAV